MKKKLLVMSLLLVFLACRKEENTPVHSSCQNESQNYESESGIKLYLEKQDWYLKANGLDGFEVCLKVAGEIVGDSAKIESYGDGLFSEVALKLDDKKRFSQEHGVFFVVGNTMENREYIVPKTKIKIFKGEETMITEIEGCNLKNPHFKP